MKRIILIISIYLFSCSSGSDVPKKIVLLIGDGMGFEQIKAAEFYNGKTFPVKESAIFSGSAETLNYSGDVTDSAAGATAMATGRKVDNGVISMAIPGTGEDLKTLFEYAAEKKYRTGLLTTSYIIDATPAAFVAHAVTRTDSTKITGDLLKFKPAIVIGGLRGLTIEQFQNAGYTAYEGITVYDNIVNNFLFIKAGEDTAPYEYDSFLNSVINLHFLSQGAVIALNNLTGNSPFILMIEGGRIDHSGHAGLIEQNVFETVEFFNTAQAVYNTLITRHNYLMIITADHETGGLNILKNNGAWNFPDVEWTSGTSGHYSHTDRAVPVFIYSDILSKDQIESVKDNTDIYRLIKGFIDN